MATTTNYGWTTPDNTALVKDGASAIRTLGSSVDTSLKSLSPGTTAGDVDYYTSSTAKARLGIGSTGQVLTVAGGVPSWATPSAGGFTLLSTTTLSGATVTISSISGSYKHLFMTITGITNATGNGNFLCFVNNDSGTNYSTSAGAANTSINVNDGLTFNNATNYLNMWLYNYSSTTVTKFFNTTTQSNTAYAGPASATRNGVWRSTTAVTSLVFQATGGNLSTGTVLLYGVN